MTLRGQFPFVRELHKEIRLVLDEKGTPIPGENDPIWDMALELNQEERIAAIFAKHAIPGNPVHIVYVNLVRLSKIKETSGSAIPAQKEPEHDSLAGAERR